MLLFHLITLGLIAGLIINKMLNTISQGIVLDIIFGLLGAFIGCWVFISLGYEGISGLNLYSLFITIAGAVSLLVASRAILGALLLLRISRELARRRL
ncbi:GlsB/YeaQ/YmgE family stress response membrane protein [Iodobacter sp. CM08]|uniref:GlsB/YeaQ/YmgE family stress response membrane protein n=1 Tax=Iodobacter sp. CM08 TaxID=3085902 RepID=UPI0029816F3D|nr:GlsB/YeaQ/YmgE family stress response membrane protein [Iodobacter sp. CM08]MDW5419147.1 GlsB/YeaQ/YmgE family stress response membrane protein [Iodobacter sp. CM08]